MRRPRQPSLHHAFAAEISRLATTLRPSTIEHYRRAVKRFLNYLADAHPQVRRLGQLRRNPHIVGWLRNLSEQNPPLANETRRNGLLNMRRLLEDLAWTSDDPPEPELILASDLPPADRYLLRIPEEVVH